MIPIRGSLWFAKPGMLWIRGDGDRFVRVDAKNGKPDYKCNDFYFFTLVNFTMIDSFQWLYYYWILRFFVFSAAHVALGIQQWYQSQVTVERINQLKIDCGCCFLVQ